MESGGSVEPLVTDSEAAEQNPVAIVDSEAVPCPAAAGRSKQQLQQHQFTRLS